MNKVLYTYNLCLFSINITNSNKNFLGIYIILMMIVTSVKYFAVSHLFFFFFGGDLKANDLKTGLTFVNKTS